MDNPENGSNNSLPDILTLYSQEINKIPLLGDEEEIALGMNIVAGLELADSSKEMLIVANTRYSRHVAINTKKLGTKVPIEELVAVANLGLVEAAQNFDPRIARFITYANSFIRSRLAEFLRKDGNGINIPLNLKLVFKTVSNLIIEAEQEEKTLSLEEIATHLSINPQTLNQYLQMMELVEKITQPSEETTDDPQIILETVFKAKDRLLIQGQKPTPTAVLIELGLTSTEENKRQIINALAQIKKKARKNLVPVHIQKITKHISIDSPFGEDADDSLRNHIPGKAPRPEQVVIALEMKERIKLLLQKLARINQKGATIINLRLGLNGYDRPLTFEEIGKTLDPSHPYSHNAIIYQENKAMAQLREIAPPDLIEYLQVQ